MGRSAYIFDFDLSEPYEIGAKLATIIGCPPRIYSEDTRIHFHALLCSSALREKCEKDPKWASQPQKILPIYTFFPMPGAKRDLNTIHRRILCRLQAGHVAMAYLKKAKNGLVRSDLPKDVKRLSVKELSKTVSKRTIDPDNFAKRIWRPSLPVIHLASALAVNMAIAGRHGKRTSLGDVIFNRENIEWIVREAEIYESLLPKTPLKIDLEKLVRIRLR